MNDQQHPKREAIAIKAALVQLGAEHQLKPKDILTYSASAATSNLTGGVPYSILGRKPGYATEALQEVKDNFAAAGIADTSGSSAGQRLAALLKRWSVLIEGAQSK